MSRKKEPEAFETDNEEFEELEVLEADAIEDDEDEEEITQTATRASKAKTPRSRKKSPALPFGMKAKDNAPKEPSTADEEEDEIDSDEEETTVVEAESKEKAAPKSRRKAKAAPKTDAEKVDAAPAAVAVAVPLAAPAPVLDNSMDSLVKQFGAVRENLEKVVTVLHGTQGPQAAAAVAAANEPKVIIQKTSLANKITLATSFIALVLSFLSLSLSQSARQASVEEATVKKAMSTFGPPEPSLHTLAMSRERSVAPTRESRPETKSPSRRENYVTAKPNHNKGKEKNLRWNRRS